jgi:hypothetical protein
MRARLFHRVRALTPLAAAALLFAASCANGTYVTLTLQATNTSLDGVARIDLDLQLAGKSASAQLGKSGGAISFPTTTVLDIASGEGELDITANALDGGGHIIAQTTGKATVTRGKTTTATLDFGTGGVVGGGGDMASGPCGVCDPAATCADDGMGGVTCTCPAGYMGDGHSCTDIDECATGAATCDANATCSNTPGSYDCSCNAGYAGDGRTCAQIWVHIADDPNVDLLNVGHAIGFGDRIFYGNENSNSLQIWHYVDVTMSTAVASTIMPPVTGQNDFCWCGNCGGYSKMVALQSSPQRFYYWCTSLEYFDAMNNAWTQASAGLPSANQRESAGVAAVGAKVYQVGGRNSSNVMVATTQTLDFTANATTPAIGTGPAYPMTIENSLTASIGNVIYNFGGDTTVGSQTQTTRKGYKLDTTGMTWVAVADMPFDTNFYPPYSAVFRNKIWAFDRNGQLHSYDPAADKWDATPPVPAPAGYGTQGRGWIPVTAGATPALYIVNYANSGGMAKISIFKYGL